MHLSKATGFCLAFLFMQACTSDDKAALPNPDEETLQVLPDMSQEPLPSPLALTADYFQQSYAYLSAEQFQKKWANSQSSGLMFARSFVNTWYDELSKVSKLGPIGPCFGDPHPENFGYIAFQGLGFVYKYNDVDDTGACPVAFDALRYFTTLKLYLKDEKIEADLRHSYIEFLQGAKPNTMASLPLTPDVQQTLQKLIKKNSDSGKIKLNPTTVAVSAEEARNIFETMKRALPECQDCSFLDAAQVVVNSGGSAGLRRYLVLVQAADQSQQLLEFKQLIEPASQRGAWSQQVHLDRAKVLADVWQNKMPEYFGFTEYEQKNFLIRSRNKADLDLDDLSGEQRKAVLTEQIWLLAQLHRQSLVGNGLLDEWLSRQSTFMASRYGDALLMAQGH